MYGPSEKDVNIMIGMVIVAALLAGVAMFAIGRCTAGYSISVDVKAVDNTGAEQ